MLKDTANKTKILKCSIELFALKGFSGTSVREIAREVGTTVPNIYYYFDSKEGLYSHILESTSNGFSQAIQNVIITNIALKDQLVAMTKAKYRFMDKYPDRMRIFFREWFAHEGETTTEEETRSGLLQALATMASMVRDRIARGEVRNVNPEHATLLVVGIFNAFDLGFIALGLTPSDQEIEAVVTLALEGLTNSKGG